MAQFKKTVDNCMVTCKKCCQDKNHKGKAAPRLGSPYDKCADIGERIEKIMEEG